MFIEIKGAKENNLKNVSIKLPKNKVIAFTGVSGSGKSTLAMETLQKECQRQFMESMGMLTNVSNKPNVDTIIGLSPAISINQHFSGNNPRSTVSTLTDLAPYIRLLFSTIGQRPCPHCGRVIPTIINTTLKTEYIENAAIECPYCNKEVIELTDRHFSYNTPQGACSTCNGVGMISMPDLDKLYDKTKSIQDFAIQGWDQVYIDRYGSSIQNAAKHYGFTIDISEPIETYQEIQMDLLLHGVLSKEFSKHFPDIKPPKTVPMGRFEGIVTSLMRRYNDSSSSLQAKKRIEKMLIQKECPDCQGKRYRKEILEVKIQEYTIEQFMALSLEQAKDWLIQVKSILGKEQLVLTKQIVDTMINKLHHLIDIGLGYVSLGQGVVTLSSGELQRIKTTTILNGGLTGVLYILDEPTAGLHDIDIDKIINVLYRLRDIGNTVIVIEHNLKVISAVDYIVDFGPSAGKDGGQIVAYGTKEDIIKQGTLTGQYLSAITPMNKRTIKEKTNQVISIVNARENNLKSVNVDIPVGLLVSICGVSGSGKTSLIFDTISKYSQGLSCDVDTVLGLHNFDSIITIDQNSIGRSSRSSPATYTGIFTNIRDVFASLPEAKKLKVKARDFSINTVGGRCENCQGYGKISIPMNFLPDVETICPVCLGKRYQNRVLEVKYRGYTISDILNMSIDEATEVFVYEKTILDKLHILQDVGLGYLGLGQSSSTLSGGEAQRLKLAKELYTNKNTKNIYLFDEPTTGLHSHDTHRLLQLFDKLVQLGNSVIVIEHNLSIISASDWIIELGPKGGIEGGTIIAQGTLEQIKQNVKSITGKILRK